MQGYRSDMVVTVQRVKLLSPDYFRHQSESRLNSTRALDKAVDNILLHLDSGRVQLDRRPAVDRFDARDHTTPLRRSGRRVSGVRIGTGLEHSS